MSLVRRIDVVLLSLAFTLPVFAGAKVESVDQMGTTRYRTYSIEEGTPARREFARKVISDAVERELALKNMQRLAARAEARIVTHVLVDRHELSDLLRIDYWNFWTGVNSVDAFDLRAGTLVIDVIDASQNRRVWRGIVSADVKRSTEKNEKIIKKGIARLLKSFPGH